MPFPAVKESEAGRRPFFVFRRKIGDSMTIRKKTFSQQIKDELVTVPCLRSCCQKAELAAALYGSARFSPTSVTIQTAHTGSADRLARLFEDHYGEPPIWQAGRELVSLTVKKPTTIKAIAVHLKAVFGDPLNPGRSDPIALLKTCCKQAMLRALFLACGSMSEPTSAYHLELTFRRPKAAAMTERLLQSFDIRPGRIQRHGQDVLYLKDGQYVADFLLLSGAHQSFMTFESLRVEKEMRNSVNRMVNCDSANTQRIADAAARQLNLIRRLEEIHALTLLPEDLQAAAEARLENPDLSLRELGETMNPPLGKSGMNHRLKRLEKAGTELLSERSVQ